MAQRRTIVVARQLGSGGTLIGRAVAERTGARYVDRELVRLAAERLGCDEADALRLEERPTLLLERLLGVLGLGGPEGHYTPAAPVTTGRAVFEAAVDLLETITRAEDCVVIGRAAAFKLRPHPGLFYVYAHAPLEARVRRVMAAYGAEPPDAARRTLRDDDRLRKRFVTEVTGRDWTCAENYHLSLDASLFEPEDAAELIVATLDRRLSARAR